MNSLMVTMYWKSVVLVSTCYKQIQAHHWAHTLCLIWIYFLITRRSCQVQRKLKFAQTPKDRGHNLLSVMSVSILNYVLASGLPQCHKYLLLILQFLLASILALLASSPTLQAFPTLAAHSLYNPAILTMLTPFVFLFPSFRLSSFPTHFVPASLMERSSLLSCSVYNFLSLLWAVPDASGCSLSYIYNKTFP